MKSLLEFMSCCGTCSSTFMVKEEASLLVAPVQQSPEVCRVRGRKRGRGIGMARSGRNKGGGSSSGVEWRPSLSSICEDNVLQERNKHDHHNHHHEEVTVAKPSLSSSDQRNLKRKVTSTPRPRSYCPREDARRPAVHAAMPTFAPAPFMF